MFSSLIYEITCCRLYFHIESSHFQEFPTIPSSLICCFAKYLQHVWATYICIQIFISSPKLPEISPTVSAHANITPKYQKPVEVNGIFLFVLPKTTTNTSTQEIFRQCGTPEMLQWKDIRVTNSARGADLGSKKGFLDCFTAGTQ